LNAGGGLPAAARLDAKARAQAFNAALSGDAVQMIGERTAAAASANRRMFMGYSSMAKDTNTPR
jgi:hypothetical protein